MTGVGTNAVRTATTDNGGSYAVTNLAPGTYEVRVAHTGFGDIRQQYQVSPGVRGTAFVTTSKELAVYTGSGVLIIESLIRAGKKEMPGRAFLSGYGQKLS